MTISKACICWTVPSKKNGEFVIKRILISKYVYVAASSYALFCYELLIELFEYKNTLLKTIRESVKVFLDFLDDVVEADHVGDDAQFSQND